MLMDGKRQATGVEYSVMAPCKSQQEALDLIALQVRLTDKGQAKLNAPQLAAAAAPASPRWCGSCLPWPRRQPDRPDGPGGEW